MIFIYFLYSYVFLGLLSSFFMYKKGLSKIDEGVLESSRSFKVLLFPSVFLLWPVLIFLFLKTKRKSSPKEQSEIIKGSLITDLHIGIWIFLTFVLYILIIYLCRS